MEKENWFLWLDGAHAPALNMAIDEMLLSQNLDFPILRLYRWNKAAVSMGYTQKVEFAPKDKEIVRRLTGGGFVDHTTQSTYSIIFPQDHWIIKEVALESYRFVNKAIMEALKNMNLQPQLATQSISQHLDRNKMICFDTPTRYDIMLNNEKIAGSAQRRTKSGILHQGSISIKNLKVRKLEKQIPQGVEKIFKTKFIKWISTKHFIVQAQSLMHKKYENSAWINKR